MKKKQKELFKKSIQKSGVGNMDDLLKAMKSNTYSNGYQTMGFKMPKDVHLKFKFITVRKGLLMQDVLVKIINEYNKKNERYLKN